MYCVAPFAGAWIEISHIVYPPSVLIVAPFAGAWIEIPYSIFSVVVLSSLPSRERGLKFAISFLVIDVQFVAPFAGAWIEIYEKPTN